MRVHLLLNLLGQAPVYSHFISIKVADFGNLPKEMNVN